VVLLNGVTVIVKAAHVRLCHSRTLFVRSYPRETQEMVFDAHDRALVVSQREGHDDADRNYRQTRMLLGQHPDLAGIYNVGGAADGVARALKEMNRAHDVVFIGHGLTSDTRSLLIEGAMDAVITQNQLNTMTSCVGIFNNLRGGRAAMRGIEAPRSEIIFRENMAVSPLGEIEASSMLLTTGLTPWRSQLPRGTGRARTICSASSWSLRRLASALSWSATALPSVFMSKAIQAV
jgi:hypothetical protein